MIYKNRIIIHTLIVYLLLILIAYANDNEIIYSSQEKEPLLVNIISDFIGYKSLLDDDLIKSFMGPYSININNKGNLIISEGYHTVETDLYGNIIKYIYDKSISIKKNVSKSKRVRVDNENNIFIFDDRQKQIFMYSSNNKLVNSFDVTSNNKNYNSSFQLDNLGNIYIPWSEGEKKVVFSMNIDEAFGVDKIKIINSKTEKENIIIKLKKSKTSSLFAIDKDKNLYFFNMGRYHKSSQRTNYINIFNNSGEFIKQLAIHDISKRGKSYKIAGLCIDDYKNIYLLIIVDLNLYIYKYDQNGKICWIIKNIISDIQEFNLFQSEFDLAISQYGDIICFCINHILSGEKSIRIFKKFDNFKEQDNIKNYLNLAYKSFKEKKYLLARSLSEKSIKA